MEIPFTSYEPCQSRQQQSLFKAEYRYPKLLLVHGVAILPEDSASPQCLGAGVSFTAGAPAPLGPG